MKFELVVLSLCLAVVLADFDCDDWREPQSNLCSQIDAEPVKFIITRL